MTRVRAVPPGHFEATATTGNTIGIVVYNASATGTAGISNNAAGGNVLVGQNDGANVFRVGRHTQGPLRLRHANRHEGQG
jgi:hypothetical protein